MSRDEPVVPDTPVSRGGGLVRVRLNLGYDGTGFSGWAMQPGLRTVEAACKRRRRASRQQYGVWRGVLVHCLGA